MIDDVQQRPGRAQKHHGRRTGRLAEQRHPQSHEDNADIFYAVVGQQALQIMLTDGESHSDNAGNNPQQQHQRAPPERYIIKERKGSQQTVDTNLQYHARHGGRNMAGSIGMSRREPDMERHDAGLHTESEQGGQKHRRRER